MQHVTPYRNDRPGLWSLYGKVLLPKSGPDNPSDVKIPALAADLAGVRTDSNSLNQYRALCGFDVHTSLPITWPHVLAFPLHLKLLTEKEFPLRLLGLVHLRNRITQHRPVGAGELLDIKVRLEGQAQTDRGLEFDLLTEAWSVGKLVWEEASTNLFRQSGNKEKNDEIKPAQPELEHYANTVSLKAPEPIGRQYGRLSGDLNPIHMHALTAKVFGFPKAIAHGMWSKAHCIALLEQQIGRPHGPVTVTCDFKKPLFLPGTAQLNWQGANGHWDYQLLNTRGDAPHLRGDITFG